MKNSIKYRQIISLMVILSILLFIIMSSKLRAAVWVSIFIVLNAALANYKKFIRLPIEIELITLGIVLCTVRFGISAGLIIAILGGIIGFIVGFNISPFSFPMLLGYISMAIVSYLLNGINISLLGIIVAIINNSIVFGLYHFVFRYDIIKNISFSVSNLFFNLIVFYNLAPILKNIMF